MTEQKTVEELWYNILTAGHGRHARHLYRVLPSDPRCRLCNAPFGAPGSLLLRSLGKRQSNMNPNLCNVCEELARTHPGGAEIELSMLFADVRSSTTLAEQMSPADYGRLINRFYVTATRILVRSDALIERLVGDQVIGHYLPGFTGTEHAQRAVKSAQELLRATGHADPAGPWIQLGIGVHTGLAFVGAVGSEAGVTSLTALGDDVNITARLSSLAGVGEVLVSQRAYEASQLDVRYVEERRLALRGRSEYVDVKVLRVLPE